jgi:hypothetical protein
VTDALVAPALPDYLDAEGWEQVDERTETVFDAVAVQVRGATRQYEDERTRAALQAATGVDHPVRFLAATRLGFTPSLPPGVSPRLFASTLRSQLRRSFGTQLEERGLVDVTHEGKERRQLPDRSRAYLNEYAARAPLDDRESSSPGAGEQSLPFECWVALWISRGTVRIVSGGFPSVVLADHFDVDAAAEPLQPSPESYREFFFDTLADTAELAAE